MSKLITYIVFKCPHCGSDEVHVTAWINANTGEEIDCDAPSDHAWCASCERDVESMVEEVVHSPRPACWPDGE